MNVRIAVLIISMVIPSLSLLAQANPGPKAEGPGGSAEVKKGYYAIGNNAGKAPASGSEATTGMPAPRSGKGYYSIRKKQGMAERQEGGTSFQKAKRNVSTTRPVIKKGYYSIGRNSEKLN